MKVVCVLGSPRVNGNTAAILDWIECPLTEGGAEVVRYCLGECDIKYCVGCKVCYGTEGECVHSDDVSKIVGDMETADLIIIASPSYWGDVTGQMKVFIDRCTPYGNLNHTQSFTKKTVKGVAVVVRAGKNKKENENLVDTIEHFLGHLNIPLELSFTVEGVDTKEDLQNRSELPAIAHEFGKSVLALLRSMD